MRNNLITFITGMLKSYGYYSIDDEYIGFTSYSTKIDITLNNKEYNEIILVNDQIINDEYIYLYYKTGNNERDITDINKFSDKELSKIYDNLNANITEKQ